MYLLRYQGPEQRSRNGADAEGTIRHGAGTHSVLQRPYPGSHSPKRVESALGVASVRKARSRERAPDPGFFALLTGQASHAESGSDFTFESARR